MDNLIGITGKDYTIIATSKAAMRGASILKANEKKTRALSSHTIIAYTGEAGDTVQLAEYLAANTALYRWRHGHVLQPSAMASYVRSEVSQSLRSRHPYSVNLLLGGVSQENPDDPSASVKPQLFWIDYLGSCAPVPYACHGYAQYYALSIMDKHHSPEMNLEQGLALLKLCTSELTRRLPISNGGFNVQVVNADGIKDIDFEDDLDVKSA